MVLVLKSLCESLIQARTFVLCLNVVLTTLVVRFLEAALEVLLALFCLFKSDDTSYFCLDNF